MHKIKLLFLLILSCFTLSMSAIEYRNPVIPGFHPDPSVLRVGDDYYAVNSSFHYFPGVPIFHSKDLIHWEQIGNVLDRPSQIPLANGSSWLGIYAPTLRYNDGIFYMITTNVANGGNFMVTATDPRGPWSEPIWLEQDGIDPSLYFEDGKCYMVSNPNACIYLCEIDPKTGKQLTESRPLWRGTGGRHPEGPHIYKKDNYYYLLISEGGTELAHSLTIARSRNIYGPYESCPLNPIMTNCNMAGAASQIQGTGHGDFVQDTNGQWWLMFLAYRNMGGSYHHLGRETCLAPVEWLAGEWPVIYGRQPIDTLMVVDDHRQPPHYDVNARYFDGSVSVDFGRIKSLNDLGHEFLYIQNPDMSRYTLRDGQLRLTGHTSLSTNDYPTFLGVRQCSDNMSLETTIDLRSLRKQTKSADRKFNAGLTIYQINDGYMNLYTDGNRVDMRLHLKSIDAVQTYSYVDTTLPADARQLRLRITSDADHYRFYMAVDGGEMREIALQNCSLLSTEVAGGFTGVTIGLYAEGNGYADFGKFVYTEQ